MSSMLADPALFSAFAIATAEDPDLVKGTHVRLLPSSINSVRSSSAGTCSSARTIFSGCVL